MGGEREFSFFEGFGFFGEGMSDLEIHEFQYKYMKEKRKKERKKE